MNKSTTCLPISFSIFVKGFSTHQTLCDPEKCSGTLIRGISDGTKGSRSSPVHVNSVDLLEIDGNMLVVASYNPSQKSWYTKLKFLINSIASPSPP